METLSDIIEGRLQLEELPLITVINNNGFYFSLNNRRLFVLKALRDAGHLIPLNNIVKVRVKAPLPREIERYTIERCCLQARIMNAKEEKMTAEDDNDNDKIEERDPDDNQSLDHLNVSSIPPATKESHVSSHNIALYHPHIQTSLRNLQKLIAKSKFKAVVEQINEWLQDTKLDRNQLSGLLEVIGLESSIYDSLK